MKQKIGYQLTQIADNDLTEIWNYTATKWGKKKANQYLQELEVCFISLTENPKLGKERPEINEGYFSVAKNKHLIFYRNCDVVVEIVRVLHQRMDIKSHV